MAKEKLVAPFLKWVGGKRQIMPSIISLMPENIDDYQYIEPFIGGGAVLFHLQPNQAILNDSNTELINVYKVVKNHFTSLIKDLAKHENTSEYFYSIRNLDRTEEYKNLTDVQRASRFIYLNKTCYNGLYRVNNAGKFNTPFGKYKNPTIINESVLKAVSQFLNENEILLKNSDYESILKSASPKSFIYLDPPYHPISESSNFTGYVQGGWNKTDQIRLKEACDELNSRHIKFLLSNSSSEFIKDLYKDYFQFTVKASRSINSKGEKRGEIDEVLIRNYE
ncbi:DNA adenine methylase [Apibacter raozihei]|uniref:DNA adenine methylase n=1 Tax=Apibacter TaxID=1778601 RepID=UPI000FE3F5D3|nr:MULTISPECIES: DNA adenine methylase [Apibacter]